MTPVTDLAALQKVIRQTCHANGLTAKAIHEACLKIDDISYTTVCNLITGETRFPRMRSVLIVMRAMGWQFYVGEINTGRRSA